MSELDELLECDAENVSNSRKALVAFSPGLSEALDTAAGMFGAFTRCLKGALEDSKDFSVLDTCAKKLGVDADALVSLIKAEPSHDPAIVSAQTAWSNAWARRARGIIFLLLQRQFMWAATDLLRMRLTPAIGYARQQVEALGLLFLIRDNPTVGHRWIRLVTSDDGKRFYHDMQSRLLGVVGHLGLTEAYEAGSATALHIRIASAARGLSLDRKPNEVWLGYQEVQADDRFTFLLETLNFLSIQGRVFRALAHAFPEVTDPIWTERVRNFTRDLASLWDRLEKEYPDRCSRLQRMTEGV
jgi:hypothetical protein